MKGHNTTSLSTADLCICFLFLPTAWQLKGDVKQCLLCLMAVTIWFRTCFLHWIFKKIQTIHHFQLERVQCKVFFFSMEKFQSAFQLTLQLSFIFTIKYLTMSSIHCEIEIVFCIIHLWIWVRMAFKAASCLVRDVRISKCESSWLLLFFFF